MGIWMSPYMSILECSEYIRLSVSTIYKKTHHREIPCRKHGRRLIFHRDEIDAWSAAQSKSVQEKPLSKFQEARQRLLGRSK